MPQSPTLLVSFGLLLAWPLGALAQPAGNRAPDDKTPPTRTERRRHDMGEVRQPELRRPRDWKALPAGEATELLAEIMAAQPERSLTSLLPGLEDYRALRERLRRVAEANGDAVKMTRLGEAGGLAVDRIDLIGPSGGAPRPRVLVVGGVHAGTEVVGVETAARLVEAAAKDAGLRGKVDLTVIPLLNPSALVLGTRRNQNDKDVNRSFTEGEWTAESLLIRKAASEAGFNMVLDLHGAGVEGRDGFFMIRYAEDGGLGERIMRSMRSADLLGTPRGGEGNKVGPYELYSLGGATSGNSGTLKAFMAENGARYSYTVEAPTRFDPELQVRGLLRMVHSAIHNGVRYGRFDSRAAPRAEPRPRSAAEAAEVPAEADASETKESDRLARFRRADGTLDWSRLRSGTQREAAGLAKFGLALFLKELAVVVQTGDRSRIEEFFDGLLTTDFYAEYGLFVVGARAAEVAYSRYLERFVRPRFVSTILKTNVVLAAGLALPQIVAGRFSGRGFAISLTALGLSSTAVGAGMRGIRWVAALDGKTLPAVRRLLPAASRAARIGGWIYSAVELAVVLYFADTIERAVEAHLDRREATALLAGAGERFLAAARDTAASPASVALAADRYHAAWSEYRAWLTEPVHRAEALFYERLRRIAREAKLAEDLKAARLKKVVNHPALRADVEARHGSLEAYAEHLGASAEADVAREADALLGSYGAERKRLLSEVYAGPRREGDYLDGVEHLDWLVRGAPASGDPWSDRVDLFARWGRLRAHDSLRSALADPAPGRLQTYGDERAVLAAAAAALSARPELKVSLDAALERVAATEAADRSLAGEIEGAAGTLRRASGG